MYNPINHLVGNGQAMDQTSDGAKHFAALNGERPNVMARYKEIQFLV